jgi:type II secretory pathway component PulM
MNRELRQFIEHNRLVRMVMRYLVRCTRREQVMLITTGMLALVCLLWLGAWEPAKAARLAAESRLNQAEQTLDDVSRLAAELEHLRQQSSASPESPGNQSLPQLLSELASETGITLAALEPSVDNLSAGVRFDAVSMESLLGWLAQLETRHVILVEQLSVTPLTANRPLAPADNLVNASLRVRMPPQ